MKSAAVLAATLFAVSTSPGFTQTLDELEAAEAKLEAASRMVAEAEEALIEVWEKTPLTFRNAAFSAGKPEGYRNFTPRANAVFKSVGDTLIMYTEPVGYGWRENEDGSYTVEFDIDLVVKNADGKIVTSQEKFDHIEVSSASRVRKFQLTLTLSFNRVAPGDYTLEYHVLDKHEGETGIVSLPFSIAE